MTVLNDLIEQAIQSSTELAQRSEAAAAEAAEIFEGANELGNLALDEAEAVHKEMAEALAALAHAHERVPEEATRAGGVLDDIPARADKTEAAVKELLAGVREDATHLADLRSRLLTGVDESAQQVDDEFHDLARRVQELQTRLDARLTEADEHVKKLRHAVEAGRTDLDERERAIMTTIETMGTHATQLAHDFADSLQAVTVVIGRSVVELLNGAVEAHNQALQALRTGLTSEMPNAPDPSDTWVGEALQPIRDAVAELALLPPAATDSVKAGAETIVEEATKAMAALTAIAHSLEQAVPKVSSTVGA